ncbi:hypothetical protein K5X82_04035 [Halosquirtibacter xylanolyticus]|uniref:hypothetical protein n=1 Tax=Halosquirtibacter xylanolyticus TaxID=3374599 RepID=UPI003748289E|nr:hypothetical protein K5X82_04035 [Prolixibacteraceae bacterium]
MTKFNLLVVGLTVLLSGTVCAQKKSKPLLGSNYSFEKSTAEKPNLGGWKTRKTKEWNVVVDVNKDSQYIVDGNQSLHYNIGAKGKKNISHQVAFGKNIPIKKIDLAKDYILKLSIYASKEVVYDFVVSYKIDDASNNKMMRLVENKHQTLSPNKMQQIELKVPMSALKETNKETIKNLQFWVKLANEKNVGADIYFDKVILTPVTI